MSELAMFSTKMDKSLIENLKKLSKETRIPQSKLATEAMEDLFKKYNKL